MSLPRTVAVSTTVTLEPDLLGPVAYTIQAYGDFLKGVQLLLPNTPVVTVPIDCCPDGLRSVWSDFLWRELNEYLRAPLEVCPIDFVSRQDLDAGTQYETMGTWRQEMGYDLTKLAGNNVLVEPHYCLLQGDGVPLVLFSWAQTLILSMATEPMELNALYETRDAMDLRSMFVRLSNGDIHVMCMVRVPDMDREDDDGFPIERVVQYKGGYMRSLDLLA
jgi:hypothetical protein